MQFTHLNFWYVEIEVISSVIQISIGYDSRLQILSSFLLLTSLFEFNV